MSGRPQFEHLSAELADWHPLAVMLTHEGADDWVALMIDMDPDEFGRERGRPVQQRWVYVPGLHQDIDSAWEALLDMLETRH